MSDDKGGSLVFILLLLVCGALWMNQPSPTKPDFTQPVDGSIEQVAVIKDYLTTEHSVDASEMLNHIPDVTKMVDPSPSDKPKPSKPEIIIFTSKSCPPCERWKRCEMQKFLDADWKVVIVDEKDHSYPRTPTFLITKDGRDFERVGFFRFEDLQEVLK